MENLLFFGVPILKHIRVSVNFKPGLLQYTPSYTSGRLIAFHVDHLSIHSICRSGGGVVDNTLDYQSRDRKIDPPLLRSFV